MVPGPIKVLLAALAVLAAVLGASSALTAARARRTERQRRELLDDVGLLQAALLPHVEDRVGGLLTSVAYRPADGPAAGGDFYDVFTVGDGRTAIVVGDVSGHGREALSQTTLIHYTLRAYLEAGLPPGSALELAGRSLDGDLGDDFATVLVAVHDEASGRLSYASAGHPPPILVGRARHEPITACASPPVGIGAPTGRRETTVSLPAGSLACIFTDGLIEARVAGELLGRQRLESIVSELAPDATAEDLIDRLVEEVDEAPDDLAACLVRPAEGEAESGPQVEELTVDSAGPRVEVAETFLAACQVPSGEVPAVLRSLAEAVAKQGQAVLRVTLSGDGSTAEVVSGTGPRLEGAQLALASR